MINFDQIPNTKIPGAYAEIDNSYALKGLPGKPSVLLVIGAMLTGSASPLALSSITSEAQAVGLYGEGSELHRIIKRIKKNNSFNELYALPLAENAEGVAAKKTVTITVNSPESGMINLLIAGRKVTATVSNTSTASSLATYLSDKINAYAELPVTASDSSGVITLTAKHKGEPGNFIDVQANYYAGETTAKGVTISIASTVSGAGNPDLAEAIAAMGDNYFTDIVCPYVDSANLTLLKTEMERRENAKMGQDCSVYCGVKGTHAELVTKGSYSNSRFIVMQETYGSPDMPEERAAALAAVAAYQYQLDPARQLRSLKLVGCLPAKTPLTAEERNLLLNSGVATTTVSNGDVLIERTVTNYLKNYAGQIDVSYLDLETVKTLAYLRYSYVARWLQKYPRHKLASDSYPVKSGQAIMTPSVAKAESIALANDWYAAGLIENIDEFKQSIISERNGSDTERLDQLLQPDIINNMRVLAGKIQFIL